MENMEKSEFYPSISMKTAIFSFYLIFICNFARGMNLIIDIGNSSAKLAAFEKDRMVETITLSNRSLDGLSDFCQKYPFRRGIYSTVINLPKEAQRRLDTTGFPMMKLDGNTPIPIVNEYKTPGTLGTDRLAAIVGAQAIHPGKDILVIDAGTAITYDFIDANHHYKGGNISPGVQMRLDALHHFTDRLPQVKAQGDIPKMGYNTETAIRAGVTEGVRYEIEGYVRELSKQYSQLLIIFTGGNELRLETPRKNTIFADKFIVLQGLNCILHYNDK
jgi:type III pantothenate kinase